MLSVHIRSKDELSPAPKWVHSQTNSQNKLKNKQLRINKELSHLGNRDAGNPRQ